MGDGPYPRLQNKLDLRPKIPTATKSYENHVPFYRCEAHLVPGSTLQYVLCYVFLRQNSNSTSSPKRATRRRPFCRTNITLAHRQAEGDLDSGNYCKGFNTYQRIHAP
jgi:hypothetical protein